VRKTFEKTQAAQLTISPEFTLCNACDRVSPRLVEACNSCGSVEVSGMTRIVGYYSRINNWNRSKIGELRDRHKGQYRVVES
jgi:ribonucleoside-triphosphate reductase